MMSPVRFCAVSAAMIGCVAFAQQKPAAPAKQAAPGKPSTAAPSAVPASAIALLPKPAINDTVHIQTHIASFKIVPKGDELPSGRLEFNFEGTVLISGFVPGSYLQTTGDVRKEYDAHDKQVYFGKGRITLVGKFRACQWFGRDLDLTFKGSGIVRVIAEFDKNLDTGYFWFEPSRKNALQTSLIPIIVPEQRTGPMPAITREEFEKQKKQLQKGG